MTGPKPKRTAWLECATGISGDMTLAALIDCGVDVEQIQAAIGSLNLPDVVLRTENVMKNGFRATQIFVDHPKQHAHRHYSDICKLIDHADSLNDRQRRLAMDLFKVVAESEAHVHGSTMEKVHFHEVGAVDSIVDIVGVAVAFDLLDVDRVVCNPIPTGSGFVKIAHGICPVPAPGTAEILRGIPLAQIPIQAELTTPTGAAIVKVMADQFGSMPSMVIQKIGYGAGSMTFPERANVLRIFVGTETVSTEQHTVCLLETNVDDVSAEILAYAAEQARQAGALDVYVTPIQMKKNRNASMVSVLCRPEDVALMEQILFRETETLGVRRSNLIRSVRPRQSLTVPTVWGDVLGKRSRLPSGTTTFAPEFEACAKIAAEHDVALRDVYRAAESAFLQMSVAEKSFPVSQSGDLSEPTEKKHDHS